MHILLQLISSKAAVFFISDENSGWLPISLLLIISFSFDLHYDCSVRHTHLFISFAWWDGLFGYCTDWCTLKMASEASWSLARERAHTAVAVSLCVTRASPAPCCVMPRLFVYHVFFFFCVGAAEYNQYCLILCSTCRLEISKHPHVHKRNQMFKQNAPRHLFLSKDIILISTFVHWTSWTVWRPGLALLPTQETSSSTVIKQWEPGWKEKRVEAL